jgi:formamidopyrimidine-DNA glycosylase
MPESPDITVYAESLDAKVRGGTLQRVRIVNPFVLRSAVPPIGSVEGQRVAGVERLGKRLVIALEGGPAGEQFLVVHLMLAGRLRWAAAGAKPKAPGALAHVEFDAGTLSLTEAGTKRRASIHLVAGRDALRAFDAGGIDVAQVPLEVFAQRLRAGRHTLKRALTDPALLSGIGNAYSDEILHRARLSPLALTTGLDDAEVARLFEAARVILAQATERLRAEAAAAGGWPREVTAFRADHAVHGRYGLPCPVCGAPVQRVVRAEQEFNYCARCQTGGRLLADRALSRLLHASWPKSIDELG